MGPSKGMPIASSARQKSLRKQTEPLQRGEWRMCANARNRCAIARWSGALLEAYSPRVHPALPRGRVRRRGANDVRDPPQIWNNIFQEFHLFGEHVEPSNSCKRFPPAVRGWL